jgi:quinol monooxygenase YgiN
MESFYLIATLKPRHDKLAEAAAALHELMLATKAEAGCELYDLVMGADGFEGSSSVDPGDWLMIEKWASRADWDAHMASAHVRHMGSVQNEFLREPTELRFYVPN